MKLSLKQEVYRELLRHSLPLARNVLSQSLVYGRSRKSAYELSQLTHNLYVSLYDNEFVAHDFWILNVHAKAYYEYAKNSGDGNHIIDLLKELFQAVPDHQRNLLEWEGP